MRVPTADYSPLQNSISNKYGAKSGGNIAAGINIASQGVNISKSSIGLAKQSQSLAQQSMEITKQHQDAQTTLSMIGIGVGVIEKIVSWGMSSQQQAQQTESKSFALDFQTGLKDVIQQDVMKVSGGTSLDSQTGNVVLGSSVSKYLEDAYSAIDEKNWSSQIKENAKLEVKSIYENNATSDAAIMLTKKASSESAKAYADVWDKTLGIDTSSAANQEAFIAGTGTVEQLYAGGINNIGDYVAHDYMDSTKAESELRRYKKEADMKYAQNGMVSLAKNGGSITLSDGTTVSREDFRERLMTNYQLSAEEVNQIDALADTAEKNYMKGLKSEAVTLTKEALKSYDTDTPTPPDALKDSIRTKMEAEHQSEEHIQEVLDEMDSTVYNWNLERTNEINSNIQDMPQGELIVAQSQLTADHKAGWYSGKSETLYEKTYTNITNEMTAEAKAQAEVIKTQVTELKTQIDTIVANEDLSATEKISMVQNMLDDKDVNVLGSQEDDKYMNQVLSKLVKEKVKQEYQPYADTTLEAITIDYATNTKTGKVKDGKITYEDKEQELAMLKVRHDAQTALGKIIDGAGQMSYQQFTDACDKVRSNFLAASMATIDKATLTQNASGDSVFKALGEMGTTAIYLEDGQYKFYDSSLGDKYAEATMVENDVLREEYGIETQGLPMMYEVKGAEGTTTYPFPVYTTDDGKKIVRTDEGFFYADSNIDVVKYPELGIRVKPIEKTEDDGQQPNPEESAAKTLGHRTEGLGDGTPTADEQTLIDDLKSNLNEKSFTSKKNALIKYYTDNNLSQEEAESKVQSLIDGWRHPTEGKTEEVQETPAPQQDETPTEEVKQTPASQEEQQEEAPAEEEKADEEVKGSSATQNHRTAGLSGQVTGVTMQKVDKSETAWKDTDDVKASESTKDHRTAGLSEEKSTFDEKAIYEELKASLNSKSFTNKRNKAIEAYMKEKGYTEEQAAKIVDALIAGMRNHVGSAKTATKKVDRTPEN